MAESEQKTLGHITVLLLGSAGSGKSFVGNILLSRTSCHKKRFKEIPGPRIEKRVREAQVHGKKGLMVIETFDLMNSSLKEEEYETHIEKWLKAADNNIDLVILVIRGDARYTKYNHDLYTCFEKYWKKKMDRSCPLNLVFTGKDILTKNDIDIKNEIEKDTISSELEELINKAETCLFMGKQIKGNEGYQRAPFVKMIETTRKNKIEQNSRGDKQMWTQPGKGEASELCLLGREAIDNAINNAKEREELEIKMEMNEKGLQIERREREKKKKGKIYV